MYPPFWHGYHYGPIYNGRNKTGEQLAMKVCIAALALIVLGIVFIALHWFFLGVCCLGGSFLTVVIFANTTAGFPFGGYPIELCVKPEEVQRTQDKARGVTRYTYPDGFWIEVDARDRVIDIGTNQTQPK